MLALISNSPPLLFFLNHQILYHLSQSGDFSWGNSSLYIIYHPAIFPLISFILAYYFRTTCVTISLFVLEPETLGEASWNQSSKSITYENHHIGIRTFTFSSAFADTSHWILFLTSALEMKHYSLLNRFVLFVLLLLESLLLLWNRFSILNAWFLSYSGSEYVAVDQLANLPAFVTFFSTKKFYCLS